MSESPFFVGKHVEVRTESHGVKRLRLLRSDIRNAFHAEMIQELIMCLEMLLLQSHPTQFRLLILEGEGTVFCSGADISYMKKQSEETYESNLKDANQLGQLFYLLSRIPTPVVSIVQGAAIGGGLGLVACSDVVITEPSAIFATSEVLIGIVPAVISPYIIRKMGVGKTSPFLLSGRKMTALECQQIGLVHYISNSPSELNHFAKEICDSFRKAGPQALRYTKELIFLSHPLPSHEIREKTSEYIAKARCSDEGREGMSCFFQKRTPNWMEEV
jgi:methylglutaconyl-CoA hydratase